MSDRNFMARALNLAERGRGKTHPNPMVGAVVVRNGRIVGEGYHPKAGQPHAEIFALRRAGPQANGATLYVSLEPCTHVGRTPPCVTAIQQAGIRRVVAAMIDPNPFTRGKGLKWLRAHGIRTRVGVLEKEARELNRVFIVWKRKNRPFITVKVAQSLDGKIATVSGQSRWISGVKARNWVHQLRSKVDAILVGIETVLKDDPRLTVRAGGLSSHPVKVIVDSRLRTPPTARLFSSKTPVIVATTMHSSKKKEAGLQRAGAQVWRFPAHETKVPLTSLVQRLAQQEISHLLIEGGGEVIASALEADIVDEVAWLIAPKIIGGRNSITSVEGRNIQSIAEATSLRNVHVRRLGEDVLVTADVA